MAGAFGENRRREDVRAGVSRKEATGDLLLEVYGCARCARHRGEGFSAVLSDPG